MSNKTQRGRFQNDLMKANHEILRLGNICTQQGQQISQLVNMLCAVLVNHHKGSVDLSPEDCLRSQEMMVNAKSLDRMGCVRISAKPVGADKLQLTDAPPPAPAPPAAGLALVPSKESATLEQEPQPEPLTCFDPWHADENAIGIRCSLCGDSRKLPAEIA